MHTAPPPFPAAAPYSVPPPQIVPAGTGSYSQLKLRFEESCFHTFPQGIAALIYLQGALLPSYISKGHWCLHTFPKGLLLKEMIFLKLFLHCLFEFAAVAGPVYMPVLGQNGSAAQVALFKSFFFPHFHGTHCLRYRWLPFPQQGPVLHPPLDPGTSRLKITTTNNL